MLAGAALYAEVYPFMKKTVLAWGKLGKITVPGVLGVSPWVVIAILGALGVIGCVWFEKRKL